MVRKRRKGQRPEEDPPYGYLVRSYNQDGFCVDTAGYFLSKDEAAAVKQDFKDQDPPGYEHSVEEFERNRRSVSNRRE